MIAALIIAALATVPNEGCVCDSVGRLEQNAFYDSEGRLVFKQLVGWDFYPEENTWHVRFWRMVKSEELVPRRDWRQGGYVVRFNDDGVFREIRAASFADSWTQEDVELIDREKLPQEMRRGLGKARRQCH